MFKHADDAVQIGDGMVALAAASSQKPTDIFALDFGQDMVEVVPRAGCLSPKESALNLEEVAGQAGDMVVRNDHASDHHQRSRIGSGSRIFNPTRFVNVANAKGHVRLTW